MFHGTLLSPKVFHLVCELNEQDSEKSIVSTNGNKISICDEPTEFNELINWDYVNNIFAEEKNDLETDSWYENKIQQLSSTINMTARFMQTLSKELTEKFWEKFLWMKPDYSMKFHHSYNLLLSNQPSNVILSHLISTSTLERLLGDVFAIKQTPVPSLLKDLLSSSELHDIFGNSLMSLLKILVGPPISLNLRNLVWHGFIAPHELHSRYCYFLLAIIAFISDHLQRNGLLHIPRPLVDVNSYNEELNIFPILTDIECIELEQQLNSSIIPPTLIPCWQEALLAYREKRFSDCLILILPQLETVLRILFAKVNLCPQRILTAESSVLYTTFAEIFNKEVCGKPNQLRNAIGDEHLIILLDLLEMPNGPRLRDRLSHGEINMNTVSETLANHTLCLSVATAFIMSKNEIISQGGFIQELFHCINNYTSKFACQVTVLKQTIELLKNLDLWKSSVGVINEIQFENQMEMNSEVIEKKDIQNIEYIIENFDFSEWVPPLRKVFISLFHSYLSQSEINRLLLFSGNLGFIIPFLLSLKLPVIYCTSKQVEVITCFRHIMECSFESSMQILVALKHRFEEYMARKLRSRQRDTYHRMIQVIPYLYFGLRVVLLIALVIILNLQGKNEAIFQSNKRFLRSLIHYVENLKIMTNSKKNRWNESKELTLNFLSVVSNTPLFS